MYYSNFLSSPEGYFQTVICNAPEYLPTVVNHDMHYIAWDNPPTQHPHTLSVNDTGDMIRSGAAFARKFKQDDPVLDIIDKELLHRRSGNFTPGGWCSGNPPCSKVGNLDKLRPGAGAQRLRRLVGRMVLSAKYGQNQCQQILVTLLHGMGNIDFCCSILDCGWNYRLHIFRLASLTIIVGMFVSKVQQSYLCFYLPCNTCIQKLITLR